MFHNFRPPLRSDYQTLLAPSSLRVSLNNVMKDKIAHVAYFNMLGCTIQSSLLTL